MSSCWVFRFESDAGQGSDAAIILCVIALTMQEAQNHKRGHVDAHCDPLLFFRKLLKHCHFLAICEKLAIGSNRDGKFPSRQ